MDERIQQAARLWAQAERPVVFSGAGMSTESGIPDFRSPGGVWSRTKPVYFQEFMSSRQARENYWRFYRDFHPSFSQAGPNPGHLALARLGRAGRLAAVVTQNIDGLHQEAGSPAAEVVELHGNSRVTACMGCGKHRESTEEVLERVAAGDGAPDCPLCGAPLKPATISFGQALPMDALQRAAQLCEDTDLLVVIGSSLTVTPAAELPLITLQKGGALLILNRDPTPLDMMAAMVFREPAGQVLSALALAMLGAEAA